MTLHLVFSPAGWSACQLRLNATDTVVLLGDAVYVADQLDMPVVSYLDEDLKIRGCKAPTSATTINYEGMVKLCTKHNPIVSWND